MKIARRSTKLPATLAAAAAAAALTPGWLSFATTVNANPHRAAQEISVGALINVVSCRQSLGRSTGAHGRP